MQDFISVKGRINNLLLLKVENQTEMQIGTVISSADCRRRL